MQTKTLPRAMARRAQGLCLAKEKDLQPARATG